MSIFDIFNKQSTKKVTQLEVTIQDLTFNDQNNIAYKIGLKRIGIDSNGHSTYTVEKLDFLQKLGNYTYLWNKIILLDLTPVLDKYGVIKECDANYRNCKVSKETTLENELKNNKGCLIAYKKYAIYDNIQHFKLKLVKTTDKSEADVQLENGTYIKILKSKNINLKIWDNYTALYKLYNDTNREIPCMAYEGIDSFSYNKDKYIIKPGETVLLSSDSIEDIIHNKVGIRLLRHIESEKAQRILYTQGREAAQNYIAHGEDSQQIEKFKDTYNTRSIRYNFWNNNDFLLACQPYDLKDDLDLIRKFTHRELYKRIQLKNNPNWNENCENEYTLTCKIINNKNEIIGYHAIVTRMYDRYRQELDISIADALNLANNNMISNATLVISDSKRPYIRCKGELPERKI